MGEEKDRMHAAVLHAPRDLRYEQVPLPSPGPDEVLVRITTNGLCGSDIHFYREGKLGPFTVSRPYIPGHEACGVVVRKAARPGGPLEGRRVAIEPGIPCRRCALCKSGRYNLCRDVVFMSAPPINGTFAEYAAVAADFAHPLPDSVDEESGAFVEPLSVGVQACTRAGLRAACSVAVIGAGPIGLVTMLVARAFGAAAVYLVDRLACRLELGARLGAAAVIDAGSVDPAARLAELTGGQGVDFVFDASGSSAACASAPALAARGGSVTIIGWPEKSVFPYPIESIIEKELDVHGTNRYCNAFPRAIALLAGGRVDVHPLVSHRFGLEKVSEAFAFAAANPSETIKLMVRTS
ncbi:MAG: NAD(P)-dependent alcohol dehydrogenase [Spirochaetes bacterium]|nr:NAD(P)-dependent alcohol dehydrogenase [Spirochaetota bacterium]